MIRDRLFSSHLSHSLASLCSALAEPSLTLHFGYIQFQLIWSDFVFMAWYLSTSHHNYYQPKLDATRKQEPHFMKPLKYYMCAHYECKSILWCHTCMHIRECVCVCWKSFWVLKVWLMFLDEVRAFISIVASVTTAASDKTTESDTFIQISNWSTFAYKITSRKAHTYTYAASIIGLLVYSKIYYACRVDKTDLTYLMLYKLRCICRMISFAKVHK